MSGDFALDAEFAAIMNASSRSMHNRTARATLPDFGGLNDGNFVTPSGGGYGPSRVDYKDERASLQLSIQMVCFCSASRLLPSDTDPQRLKKYDTIVKGFKVLESGYEETKKKLITTEERLSTVSASHEALIAAMESAQQVLHDRENVRQHT
jgi:hypothetical protein